MTGKWQTSDFCSGQIFRGRNVACGQIKNKGEKYMPSLNHVVLIGRLTRDPELRQTPSGTAVANFTIAVDRRPKPDGAKDADFIRVAVWGKQGEACSNYLAKGRMVAVEGRLQVHSYQNQDGQNRTTTEVIAEHVQFLTAKGKTGAAANGSAEALSPEADIPEESDWQEDPSLPGAGEGGA
jgi:single-strand DNA-binding protein